MRQRMCAAALLCAPLVAGCGSATPVRFAGHWRPAAPVHVSVWSDARSLRLDPSRVRPGPVIFDIANESGRPERFSVRARGGRLLARTPVIASGQTAQLSTTLSGSGNGLGAFSARTRHGLVEYAGLSIGGQRRDGNGALLLP